MLYSLDGREVNIAGPRVWVAPDATVLGKVTLHEGATVWFGAVLRGDTEEITIGPDTNVQDLSVVHTDIGFPTTLGRGVTVGHRVVIHGCTIGDYSLIGINSVVLNGAKIGNECLVGAHSLVTEGKSFPDRSLIMGSPAKVVRQLTDAEVENIRNSAAHYSQNGQRFAAGLHETATP